MKKVITLSSIVLATLTLAACSKEEPKTQIPNPAATFCIDQGGEFSINKTDKGDVGFCTLKDGSQVDAWQYFRENNKDKS
ncbi:DUF333 domain-containing protein [Vibrio sp. CK2-1]|uniref:putative hemolysin n=1 Tax=Vibrio sp. CK2-1 TaxID=2912249 RepID=UPI001F410D3A|nr:DUF333 domain-containing protein [Vibrio sp. CK2-1]MCF7353217.1 DUF333 domain-containing protein [Vibrio sp. CK2-1]